MALAATYMLAALSLCPVKAPPQVFFVYSEKTPVIHHDVSARELGRSWPKTNTAMRNEFPTTNGYTNGKIKADFDMQFAYQGYHGDLFCLWPVTVRVYVSYTPNVFIASDDKEGGCRYKDTMKHEYRHVQTDIAVLKKYLPALEAAARVNAKGMKAPPPLSHAHMVKARQDFVDGLQAAISEPLDALDKERTEKQALIDTRQEYLRASRACVR